ARSPRQALPAEQRLDDGGQVLDAHGPDVLVRDDAFLVDDERLGYRRDAVADARARVLVDERRIRLSAHLLDPAGAVLRRVAEEHAEELHVAAGVQLRRAR